MRGWKPKKGKNDRQKLISACDDLFREIIWIKDKGVCQRSHKRTNLQVAHFHTRAILSLRWNEDNACLLNANTHHRWAHVYHAAFRDFWIKRVGDRKFNMLKWKAQFNGTIYTSSIKLLRDSLRARLKELKGLQ